jgi:hypothetical protein
MDVFSLRTFFVDVLIMDVLSPRTFCHHGTFCRYGRFVSGRFVSPEVSGRTFCRYGRFVTRRFVDKEGQLHKKNTKGFPYRMGL